MYPQQLIGKTALRTAPTNYGDYSYTNSPIKIMAATENHVVYQYIGKEREVWGDQNRVLDCRWVDNSWTAYDELMSLATEEHIDLLNKIIQ